MVECLAGSSDLGNLRDLTDLEPIGNLGNEQADVKPVRKRFINPRQFSIYQAALFQGNFDWRPSSYVIENMSYKSFTFYHLTEQFELDTSMNSLFNDTKLMQLEPSQWLWKTLEIASNNGLKTQKERSERIISPILLECLEKNNRQISMFSGWLFDVDIDRELKGKCDFLLSCVPLDLGIKVPFFILKEAEAGEIETALSQCAAQMLAAQIFNDRQNNHIPEIFGCVTTGIAWRFLKLAENNLTIDADIYCLDNLPLLLGILQTVVDLYKNKKY